MTDNTNIPEMNDEELDSTILLSDEEGKEAAYDIADYIELGDKEYVVLVPQAEDDDEVVILRVEEDEEDEDTELFVPEEDEEILQKVFDIFKDRFADEYEFTDEDEDSLFTDAE